MTSVRQWADEGLITREQADAIERIAGPSIDPLPERLEPLVTDGLLTSVQARSIVRAAAPDATTTAQPPSPPPPAPTGTRPAAEGLTGRGRRFLVARTDQLSVAGHVVHLPAIAARRFAVLLCVVGYAGFLLTAFGITTDLVVAAWRLVTVDWPDWLHLAANLMVLAGGLQLVRRADRAILLARAGLALNVVVTLIFDITGVADPVIAALLLLDIALWVLAGAIRTAN